MGMFSELNLNNYRSSKGGNYFKPGRYVGRLLAAKGIEYGQGEKKDTAFVAEFELLESNNEDQPAGDRPSYFVGISSAKFPKTAKGNIADCMRAMVACREVCEGGELLAIDDVEISNETADAITDEEEQPMAGTIMGIQATEITTKAGNPFTKVQFFVPDNAPEYFEEA